MKVIVTENKIQGGAKAFEIFEKGIFPDFAAKRH